MSACPLCCHYMAGRDPLPLGKGYMSTPERERLSRIALLLAGAIRFRVYGISARHWLVKSVGQDVTPEQIEEALSYCSAPDRKGGKDSLRGGLVRVLCELRGDHAA